MSRKDDLFDRQHQPGMGAPPLQPPDVATWQPEGIALPELWVLSDTHFFHARIAKYCHRPADWQHQQEFGRQGFFASLPPPGDDISRCDVAADVIGSARPPAWTPLLHSH